MDDTRLQDIERRLKLLESRRIHQSDFLPGVVNSRALGEVILPVSDSTASATFGNGDQVVLTHTLAQEEGAKVLAQVELGIYIGSVAAANQLPGGSGIDESQFQVIGPWFDWDATDGNNSVMKVYVRNISAGSVTIIFKLSDRYLSNLPNAASE